VLANEKSNNCHGLHNIQDDIADENLKNKALKQNKKYNDFLLHKSQQYSMDLSKTQKKPHPLRRSYVRTGRQA